MVFLVFFEPEVFAQADENGDYARKALISVIHDFLQNCLVCDFIDYSFLCEAIGEKVKAMSETFDRTCIKKLLMSLKTKNRFVGCLKYDYSGEKSEFEMLLEQCATIPLDIALLTQKKADAHFACTTLSDYSSTDFKGCQSKAASEGETVLPQEERSPGDFFSRCFHAAFRYSSKIEVCDRLFGKQFGDNYKFSIAEFYRWLGQEMKDPRSVNMIIHCGLPGTSDRECTAAFFLDELKKARDSGSPGMPVKVQFYDSDNKSVSLPHERFIITEQFCFDIGRGMDFLDFKTRKNRDTKIKLSSKVDSLKLLEYYAGSKKAAYQI